MDENYVPVEDAHKWLRHLRRANKSPRTLETYAYGVRHLLDFGYLTERNWRDFTLENIGQFAEWLAFPALLPSRGVRALEPGQRRRSDSTVSLYLAAMWAFYDFHHSNGVQFAFPLWGDRHSQTPYKQDIRAVGRTSRRPFEITVEKKRPSTLTLDQIHAVVTAPRRRRDQFLFALLATTGMRIGAVLGLRHEDFQSWDRALVPQRRTGGDPRARYKSSSQTVREPSTKLLTSQVIGLHNDYMFEEYGNIDSDFIFIDIWSGAPGTPMSYSLVNDIVRRTRRKVGFHFTPHMFRHTFATMHLEAGVAPHIVAEMLDHASSETTTDIYGHISTSTLRRELEQAGVINKMLTGGDEAAR